MIVYIYVDNKRVDMFKDEMITIVSSVLDIRDITKNTTEFSNTFTLPASNVNNIIFKHYYNAYIDNGFDARISINARIEISGIVFREGKLTLQKVAVKNGKPYSYTVGFFGELLSLKDIIGSDKLTDLDTSDITGDYTPAYIKSLMTASSGSNLICPLVAKKRYILDTGTPVVDESTRNVHYQLSTDKGFMWSEVVPAVKLSYLISRIEYKYGITFSTGFISQAPVDKLYMLCDNKNFGKGNSKEHTCGYEATKPGLKYITTTGIDIDHVNLHSYRVLMRVVPDEDSINIPYTLRVSLNYQNTFEITGIGIQEFLLMYDRVTYDLYFTYTVETERYFSFQAVASVQEWDENSAIFFENNLDADQTVLSTNYDISKHLPDMGVLEFLKGLLNAFKLVIIPSNDGTIYLDTIKSFFDIGKDIDITKYIDTSSYDVSRGTLLNTVSYKFKEPGSVLAKQFKGTLDEGYGDEIYYIKDDNGNLIDGNSQQIELPFEQMIYERLLNGESNIITSICYGALIDSSLEPIDIKAHLFYPIRQVVGDTPIGFKSSSSTVEDLGTWYFRPSHRESATEKGISFLFGEEIDEYTREILSDNLYSEYYNDYISSLFNDKRRLYDYNAKGMPISIVNNINLNDIIYISGNPYRINNFKSNIINGDVKFNLYNMIADE